MIRLCTHPMKRVHFCVPARRAHGTQRVKSCSGIPSQSFIANMGNIYRNGGFKKLQDIQSTKFAKFGPIFMDGEGPKGVVNIANTEDFATVFSQEQGKFPVRNFVNLDGIQDSPLNALIGNDENRWREARQEIAQPLLVPNEVERFTGDVDAIAWDFAQSLLIYSERNGRVPSLVAQIDGYTSESVCCLVYGDRPGFFATPRSTIITELIAATLEFRGHSYALSIDPPFVRHFKAPILAKAQAKLRDIAQQFANRAASSDRTGKDYLYDRMIAAGKSARFVEDTAIALCQGGIDTTSTGFLWCLYEMARNPHVQEKAYNEIVSTIGPVSSATSHVGWNYLGQIPYVKNCVRESLRLHPVVTVLARTIPEEAVLCGHNVAAHTSVVMWPHVTAYSDSVFEQPYMMKPERWSRTSAPSIGPFAFLPFGFGVRACIGRRFAMFELTMGLARVLQRFRLEYDEKDSVHSHIQNGLVRPEVEPPIKFIERSKN